MNNAPELAKTADLADALDGLADEIQEVTSTQAGYEFSSQGERVRAVVTLETSENGCACPVPTSSPVYCLQYQHAR